MTGQSKNPRGWTKLQETLLRDDFQIEIVSIRKLNDFQRIPMVQSLIKNYKLPTSYFKVISHYVDTDEIDARLINQYVTIDTSKGVSLRLAFDTTQPELIDFIKTNWKSDILPALKSISGDKRRVNSGQDPQADRRAYDDYMGGMSVVNAAASNNISTTRLQSYIKKQKPKEK